MNEQEIYNRIAELETKKKHNRVLLIQDECELTRCYFSKEYIELRNERNGSFDGTLTLLPRYDSELLSLISKILKHTEDKWKNEKPINRSKSLETICRSVELLREDFTNSYNPPGVKYFNFWDNLTFLLRYQIGYDDSSKIISVYTPQPLKIEESQINGIFEELFPLREENGLFYKEIERLTSNPKEIQNLKPSRNSSKETIEKIKEYKKIIKSYQSPKKLPFINAIANHGKEMLRIDMASKAINFSLKLDLKKDIDKSAFFNYLQVIGESVHTRNISLKTYQLIKDVDWQLFIDLRDKLFHGEDDSISIIRDFVDKNTAKIKKDLECLQSCINQLKKSHNEIKQSKDTFIKHYNENEDIPTDPHQTIRALLKKSSSNRNTNSDNKQSAIQAIQKNIEVIKNELKKLPAGSEAITKPISPGIKIITCNNEIKSKLQAKGKSEKVEDLYRPIALYCRKKSMPLHFRINEDFITEAYIKGNTFVDKSTEKVIAKRNDSDIYVVKENNGKHIIINRIIEAVKDFSKKCQLYNALRDDHTEILAACHFYLTRIQYHIENNKFHSLNKKIEELEAISGEYRAFRNFIAHEIDLLEKGDVHITIEELTVRFSAFIINVIDEFIWEQIDQLNQYALQAFDNNDLPTAKEKWEDALLLIRGSTTEEKYKQKSASLNNHLGNYYWKLKEYQAAINHFDKVLTYEREQERGGPNNDTWWKHSKVAVKRCIGQTKIQANQARNEGEAHMKEKQWSAAVPYFEDSLEKNKNFDKWYKKEFPYDTDYTDDLAVAYWNLGRAYFEQGQEYWTKAEPLLKEAHKTYDSLPNEFGEKTQKVHALWMNCQNCIQLQSLALAP